MDGVWLGHSAAALDARGVWERLVARELKAEMMNAIKWVLRAAFVVWCAVRLRFRTG
jgi:hypothetical protein